MRRDMQPMKTPRMSATKLTTNPDIDYDRLLAMSEQTLGTSMAPPVSQDQLDSASGMRDLGSLAAALSGAVRGAGSVGGKLPNDFGFDQIARDMGNSRTVDLQNRMALRKQQENDMLEAIKNSGIADRAKKLAAMKRSPLSAMDRAYANKQVKELGIEGFTEFPAETTYGDLWDSVIGKAIGFGGDGQGSDGMSEYQKIMTDLRATEVKNNADLRDRGLGIQGVTASTAVDAAAAKEADRIRELERVNEFISKAELEALHIGLKRAGVKELPKSVTRGEVEKSALYTSILKGAAPTANQTVIQGRLKEKDSKSGGAKPLTEAQELKAMENLTKNLGQGGYTEAWEAMNTIKNLLSKYPKGKNIPGVGVGGALNLNAAYERFTNDDAKEIERTAAVLANIKIKNRSGSAVTVPEFERLRPELGSGTWRNETNFRNAMDAAYKALVSRTKDQIAPYKKAGVYQTWVESGEGTDYEKFLPDGVGIVPGNESIPKGEVDRATDNFNQTLQSEPVPNKRRVFKP